MTLSEQTKFAAHIQRLLKVSSVSFPIARTEKGNLEVMFTKDQEGYTILLDAVPQKAEDILNDENNIELKRAIQRYFFDQELLQGFLSPEAPAPVINGLVADKIVIDEGSEMTADLPEVPVKEEGNIDIHDAVAKTVEDGAKTD